jgi:hypothetical protein
MTFLPPTLEGPGRTGVTSKEALLGQRMPPLQQEQQQQLQLQQQQQQQQFQMLSQYPQQLYKPPANPSSQQMPVQPMQYQQQMQAHVAAYNNFMQPQPLLPSSAFSRGRESTMTSASDISDSMHGHLEPTPINPSVSQAYPFPPLEQIPSGSSCGGHGSYASSNNGRSSSLANPTASTLPSNALPLDPPPPLWGPPMKMSLTDNTTVNEGGDSNGSDAASFTQGSIPANQWQNIFSAEEEDLWSQHMGV